MQLLIISKDNFKKLKAALRSYLHPAEVAVVKSNICGFYPPDNELLGAILSVVGGHAKKVYLGDTASTMYRVEGRLEKLGLYEVAEKAGRNVSAADFMSLSDAVRVEVPRPHASKSYPFPRIVLDADLLVNVARIGSHPTTVVTAALKNLFGLVASRMKYPRYHPRGMDKVIADIAQIIKPDLNVVEASGHVVVSPDPLAADVAASLLIGVDPRQVKHFQLVAEDRGISFGELLTQVSKIVEDEI